MVCTLAVTPAIDWARDEDSLALLVSSAAGGDEQSLAQLYDRTSGLVYGLALRILREATSAEDITLEVYMQVWRTAQSYDPARGTVSAWLVTLARSRAIDWLRSKHRRRMETPLHEATNLQDSRPGPEHVTIEAGQARRVQDAMAVLPTEQRHLINLAYFSGMSHSEIADRTELPLGTVKTRIRLGMLRLRELLGAERKSW